MMKNILIAALVLFPVLSACGSSKYKNYNYNQPTNTTNMIFKCPHCSDKRTKIDNEGKYKCGNCSKNYVRINCYHCATPLVIGNWGWFNCPKCSKKAAATFCYHCDAIQRTASYSGNHTCSKCSRGYYSDICPNCKVVLAANYNDGYTKLNCFNCKKTFEPIGYKGSQAFTCMHCKAEQNWPNKSGVYRCSGCNKDTVFVDCFNCKQPRMTTGESLFTCKDCNKTYAASVCAHCNVPNSSATFNGYQNCTSCQKGYFSYKCPHCSKGQSFKWWNRGEELACKYCGKTFTPALE